METKTKLVRAKVQLQNEKPFFAYLIMNMRFIENKGIPTIGVNSKGECHFNPKFIDTLREQELKGVLAHEVLHLVLEHCIREKDNKIIWNVATDLCINDILTTNHFVLPSGLIPDYHTFEFDDGNGNRIKIEEIDKKNADIIYAELLDKLKDDDKTQQQLNNKRFDNHIKPDGKDMGVEQKRGMKDKWKKAVSEASAYARDKGNLPNGLEIFIDELLNEKVNWKHILYKYLTRTIPYDYTYARPSKRSFSTGVYMPTMRKECIEIVVSLDTSGSIQSKELSEFMSEIKGIAKSFNNLSMKLIVCDSEIKNVYTIGNGDSEEIEKLIIKGGGGTSHIPVYEYVKNNLPNTKLLVNFTDGYTDLDELDNTINTLWVICKHGIGEDGIPFGEVIKLS